MSHDWEKRARELLDERRKQHNDHVPYTDYAVTQAALQLGREIADARAEEIASEIISADLHFDGHASVVRRCIEIALSTITKPEPKTREQVPEVEPLPLSHDPFLREQQLIQKARDEAYLRGWKEGLESGRKSVVCIVPREQVLEKALREIERAGQEHGDRGGMSGRWAVEIARRALEIPQ